MTRADVINNHGRVLLIIAREPDIRLERLAEVAGITERSVSRIIDDLERAGYLTREGRPNLRSYRIHPEARLRGRLASGTVSDLLNAFP